MEPSELNKFINYIKQPLEVRALRFAVLICFAVPALMLLVWFITPQTPVDLFILNKTVPDVESRSRNSLYWILNNERITKPDGEKYSRDFDYYGVHPVNSDSFAVKDLSDYSSGQVDSLANALDAAYFVDTYGIYAEVDDSSSARRRLIYGGLQAEEVDLLVALKNRSKLIISEFNILDAPTSSQVRQQFLNEFHLQLSGWVGRYFDSLDSTGSSEVPDWALELHRQKTGRAWPYKRSGVIMINHASELIVLESGSMLKHEVPSIYTRPYYREKYNLPERVSYTSWFEMIYSPTRENAVISSFQIPVTEQGDSLLTSRGLSPIFPAVLGRPGFYYFAGSFSENRVPATSSYFKGIRWFRSFFYNSGNVLDRRAFFWRYYQRLLSSILNQLKDK